MLTQGFTNTEHVKCNNSKEQYVGELMCQSDNMQVIWLWMW